MARNLRRRYSRGSHSFKSVIMLKTVVSVAVTLVCGTLLSGCGLAETGVAGAAAGASQVEQVRQAKQTEAQVQKQLDAASQLQADRRQAAEAESQ